MADNDNNMDKQIGNYRLIAEIGSGGYGRVYLGQHIFLTDRTVAVKLLHTHLASSEECNRALEEARLLEKLKHPHVLHIFDVGIDGGFPYLVAEYAPEGSLRDRIKDYKPNPLPLEEVMNILRQVGQALQYAHQQHIIHRDLKPENILFNSKKEVMLADFGIATTLSTTSSVKAATILGTPLYMAPEQFKGNVSKESDQYSLGCIAYELVTGRAPFNAADFFTLGFCHITATPVPPWELNPQLSMHVGQAILKAMAKQRIDRHASIQAFITALHTSSQKHPPVVQQAYSGFIHVQQQTASTHPASLGTPQELTQTGFSGTAQQMTDPRPVENNNGQQQLSSTLSKHHLASQSQEPITPLTPPTQTPPFPLTSFPTQPLASPYEPVQNSVALPLTHASVTYGKNPITPLPEQTPALSSEMSKGSHRLPQNSSPVMPEKTGNKKSTTSKRKWSIIAAICIALIASTLGVALPLFSQHSDSTKTNTPLSQTTMTTTIQTAVGPITKTTAGVPGRQTTPMVTPEPTAAPSPTKTPMSVPTFGPTVTATTPTTDNLVVPFTSSGVPTTHSYHGTVTIIVRGTGRASQTQYSDAFYVYTDTSGTPITPYHPVRDCWVLDIDGQPADHYISLPAYNANHSYMFTLSAPGGVLTFNECDAMTSDNTGSYYITVTQN